MLKFPSKSETDRKCIFRKKIKKIIKSIWVWYNFSIFCSIFHSIFQLFSIPLSIVFRSCLPFSYTPFKGEERTILLNIEKEMGMKREKKEIKLEKDKENKKETEKEMKWKVKKEYITIMCCKHWTYMLEKEIWRTQKWKGTKLRLCLHSAPW